MRLSSLVITTCWLAVSALVATACNKRVFVAVEPSCDRTIPVDVEIPLVRAADILIVVDSSGSMAEEQQKLVDNFLNTRCTDASDVATCECPLQDLTRIPEELANPAPELYAPGGPLARCGFIQLLAAFENDFRVGVITTDVGPCDNRFATFGDAPADFRPQRGCLQPDGPARDGARLVLSRNDLFDDDATNDDLAERFRATLENIGTRGVGFERGLDAMEIFLDPEAERAPPCGGDLASFRREGAQLAVIYLSDEEDCSHADGAYGFADEGAGLLCGENTTAPEDTRTRAERCYLESEDLAPVERYVQALQRADPTAKLAVIAGLVDVDGAPQAADCRAADPASPSDDDDAPSLDCWPSLGNSNFTGPGQICGDAPDPADPRTAERAGRPCCVADAGHRAVAFAEQVAGQSAERTVLLDSICARSFAETMIGVAALIGATNTIELVEPPAGGALLVTTVKAGSAEEVVVPRIDAAACADESGFYLDGALVVFCNDAVPAPGDRVQVRARGVSDTARCADQGA